jgi:DNA-binding response OmpR family regulator
VATVALIEDEPGIADFVSRGLGARGLTVQTALDGEAGLALALSDEVDLVILDLMLPLRDGREILDELARQRPGLPVIVLTALAEVEDRVDGLKAGAVDYLVKPFAFAELEARVQTHLRMARQMPATRLRVGPLVLDLLEHRATLDGEQIRLSNTEFDLLKYFMRNPGQVLSREQILRAVWGYDHDPTTNGVDVYVGYLRRKLTRDDHPPVTISTLRSRGYRLDDPR